MDSQLLLTGGANSQPHPTTQFVGVGNAHRRAIYMPSNAKMLLTLSSRFLVHA